MQFQDFLTFENIYFWANCIVLPFWILLITLPNSKFTQFFLNSIIFPLILGSIYTYVIYQAVLLEESLFDVFRIYLSLDSLYTVFATESFLLLFWLHFITINLFLGSWIARDGVKHNIHRGVVSIPLILVYFAGPLGLVAYWLVRIFRAKRLSFHD
jgi:hypothetical protein